MSFKIEEQLSSILSTKYELSSAIQWHNLSLSGSTFSNYPQKVTNIRTRFFKCTNVIKSDQMGLGVRLEVKNAGSDFCNGIYNLMPGQSTGKNRKWKLNQENYLIFDNAPNSWIITNISTRKYSMVLSRSSL